MMLLFTSIYFVSSFIIPHVVGQVPPMFVLTCNDYPDVYVVLSSLAILYITVLTYDYRVACQM